MKNEITKEDEGVILSDTEVPDLVKKIPLSQDPFVLNHHNFDSNIFASLLVKKVSEDFYEKVDVNDIKISKADFIKIELTKTETLILDYWNKFGDTIALNERYMLIKHNECYVLIKIDHNSSFIMIPIIIYSSSIDKIDQTYKDFIASMTPVLQNEDIAKFNMNWYTMINGRADSYFTTEYLDDLFIPECYPYIDVENLITNYIQSEIPVLFMLGPPGTGKTRLIREVLKQQSLNRSHEQKSLDVIYTSSKEIIEEGTIYLHLLFDSTDTLVLEDIDYHITPRKDGNTSMYNLLSVSNGILANKIKQKKIILSSNLPNLNTIDEALLRPGRCFDIIKTRKLVPDEADVVCEKIGKKRTKVLTSYSLADLYN